MAAKVIQLSDDAGVTWYTLPGNSGEFSDEAGELDDTIFGQNYKSGQSNLINWSISANAVYKGFAGYTVDIKKSGTSTTFTGEATTLVSGKTFAIDDSTKDAWDPAATFVVYDGGVDHTADVLNIDFLFGRVTFKAAYTVTGAVTVDGKYLPLATMASYRSFNLTQTMEAIDDTDIPAAQANNGHRTMDYGLKTVQLDVSGVYAVSNGFRAELIGRNQVIVEINPDGGSKSVARGFFRNTTRGQSGDVGALEEENVSYTLSVPAASLLKTPFQWLFTSSDLSTSVIKSIEAWQNETALSARYLPDGSTGLSGAVVVSDISLQGGLEAMNEFTVSLQGSGEVSTV